MTVGKIVNAFVAVAVLVDGGGMWVPRPPPFACSRAAQHPTLTQFRASSHERYHSRYRYHYYSHRVHYPFVIVIVGSVAVVVVVDDGMVVVGVVGGPPRTPSLLRIAQGWASRRQVPTACAPILVATNRDRACPEIDYCCWSVLGTVRGR